MNPQREESLATGARRHESLGTFAGGFAHDFNNLLTGTIGHAALARQRAGTDSTLCEHLERLESLCQRAAQLCRQMLAYAGQTPLVLVAVDLNGLIEDSRPALAESLSSHVTLDVLPRPTLPVIQADGVALRQAIQNVVVNAGEAIGEPGGKVTVATGTALLDERFLQVHAEGRLLGAGEYVFVEVRDTGCGMTDEIRLRIFEPFFSTKSAGRGLGLAAVQGTVHGHGGLITVRSNLGEGTTVRLLLPLDPVPPLSS